jgi:hypothetical protein
MVTKSKDTIEKPTVRKDRIDKPTVRTDTKYPVKKLGIMEELMWKMNISETKTKPIKYNFPKVKYETFPKNGYNYQDYKNKTKIQCNVSSYRYL